MDDALDGGTADIVSGLIDLSGVDLTELAEFDNPVLAGALVRIQEEAVDPDAAVAGFSSSI